MFIVSERCHHERRLIEAVSIERYSTQTVPRWKPKEKWVFLLFVEPTYLVESTYILLVSCSKLSTTEFGEESRDPGNVAKFGHSSFVRSDSGSVQRHRWRCELLSDGISLLEGCCNCLWWCWRGTRQKNLCRQQIFNLFDFPPRWRLFVLATEKAMENFFPVHFRCEKQGIPSSCNHFYTLSNEALMETTCLQSLGRLLWFFSVDWGIIYDVLWTVAINFPVLYLYSIVTTAIISINILIEKHVLYSNIVRNIC